MDKRDEIKRHLIAVFGEPVTPDHEKQIEAHVECAEMWGDYYAERENARLLKFLTDIRFALGDDSKRMQDEFVTYCEDMKAERDRLREFIDSLYSFGLDLGYGKWQDDKFHIFDDDGEGLYSGETVMEVVEAYLKGKGDGDKGE